MQDSWACVSFPRLGRFRIFEGSWPPLSIIEFLPRFGYLDLFYFFYV